MESYPEITPEIRENMESKNIDVDLSLSILAAYNRGEYDHFEPITVQELPNVDGETVIDFTGTPSIRVSKAIARERLAALIPNAIANDLDRLANRVDGADLVFEKAALEELGLLLLPRVAYGVLNGGSATSYADTTKNSKFSSELFELLGDTFGEMAELSRGRAKGLTPAFVQPDGSFGPSFLQLKMRNLLIMALRSKAALERHAPGSSESLPMPLLPFFQMTSIHTDDELAASYTDYRSDEPLADLIALTGLDPTDPEGGVQPLISAYTHGELGRPKQVFTKAWGRENETLPLPGGHGQSFWVLKDVYRRLHESGKRFVYLGNVDNLGFLPDPASIAYLALSGKQAAFDFAYKTPVDVKGGILVKDQAGHLNCADIGPAVSKEDVAAAESAGKPILFNAATGLFDLDYLVPNIERIIKELPTRFTDQDKDAGRYSQAEQVTWEVLGMLDDFLVCCVSKWDRFLAAKLLSETLMTSGIKIHDPSYPTSDDPAHDLKSTAEKLHDGLIRKLEGDYGMRRENGRWEPIPAAEVKARIESQDTPAKGSSAS
ncbi:MAG: UTP--glucose-1-phosphate uridylyltransferase [Spirochaetota bacterium]